ncbi:UDP-glucose 4-epimerase GalE [Pseudonocardia saturnea]
MPSTVLVTGGAGFIGSHTCVELLTRGHDVVVVDDFSNSAPQAIEAMQKLAGRPLAGVHEVDVRDRPALDAVFASHPVDAVVHFAAKKAVGESMSMPLDYFDINVGGTTALLCAMRDHKITRMVFSSSCSIYGETDVPLDEDQPARPTNPYARSKHFCEQILRDACQQDTRLSVIALRYFNPIGAHPSGNLGEDPKGRPNNVLPYLAQVAVGRLAELPVFGSDYPTPDGTCVRDYVHVVDVADGHRVALDHLDDETGMRVFNLGTGTGVSVLDLVAQFSTAVGESVPYRLCGRRPGDVPTLVADPGRIARAWGWRTTRDLAQMCMDAWRFQLRHPNGYGGR